MTNDTAQARALDHTAICAAVPAGTRLELARQDRGKPKQGTRQNPRPGRWIRG